MHQQSVSRQRSGAHRSAVLSDQRTAIRAMEPQHYGSEDQDEVVAGKRAFAEYTAMADQVHAAVDPDDAEGRAAKAAMEVSSKVSHRLSLYVVPLAVSVCMMGPTMLTFRTYLYLRAWLLRLRSWTSC